MGDYGFKNTLCMILIIIVVCALSLGAGIMDVITMIGKQEVLFCYIVLTVWAGITILTALKYKKGVSSFIEYLVWHSVTSLIYGWCGSKILHGMIYPWGDYDGWFEELLLKNMYVVIGVFLIFLFIGLTEFYILIIQAIREEALDETENM